MKINQNEKNVEWSQNKFDDTAIEEFMKILDKKINDLVKELEGVQQEVDKLYTDAEPAKKYAEQTKAGYEEHMRGAKAEVWCC